MHTIQSYRVTWTIDVEAHCPSAAADQARAMQRREGTTATVYTVEDDAGNSIDVDLLDYGLRYCPQTDDILFLNPGDPDAGWLFMGYGADDPERARKLPTITPAEAYGADHKEE